MKLKRIFVALMLVAVVAAAGILTACGGVDPITEKADAIDMLKEVAQKQSEVKNYSFEMSMEGKEDGVSSSMKINAKIKDGEFESISETEAMGITANIKQYYTGGYLYSNMGDMKFKMEFDLEDAMEDAMGGMTGDIDAEMIDVYNSDDWAYEGKADGNLYVFVFTSEEEGTMTIKVNKDKLVTYTCFEMDDMKMEATYKYSTPKLDFPSDLDTYEEMDSDFDLSDIFG